MSEIPDTPTPTGDLFDRCAAGLDDVYGQMEIKMGELDGSTGVGEMLKISADIEKLASKGTVIAAISKKGTELIGRIANNF